MSQDTHGYSANKDAVLKRVRRIEGQVRGIEKMVDDDRYCLDIFTQIIAAQAALDNAQHCVIGAKAEEQGERTEELMGAVKRLLRYG